MQNNYPVLKPKNTLNEHRWHFATAVIVPHTTNYNLYCSSHLTLTTDVLYAPNITKTWDWLFDCLYRLSKLVEIHMINRISKTICSRTHTPWVPLTYWILLGPLMTTHNVSFEVTVPSTLIVTNWAADRLFTSVNIIHTGERPAQFVTINVDGTVILWPQTTLATCVVISRPSRIQ